MTAGPGERPRIHPTAFVAPTASVMGDVTLGPDASVWYGAVLRGDMAPIVIGGQTNLQDGTIVHVDDEVPCIIGEQVGVGHRVILHGCTIADHVLVGMGAIVMDGVEVEPWSFIGAGAVVTPGTKVASGSLVLGAPAKVVRPINDKERGMIEHSASHYLDIARSHAASARPISG